MAVLIFGLVGSAIGGAIGGSVMGSIGYMVGSTIGQLLTQPNQHADGPRVGDLSMQVSTYGLMRPIKFGTVRMTGNVIFCTDKREVATTVSHRSSWLGPKISSTSYSYNVDIAIGLGQGPIAGIRKIWRNGELIYDASATATISSVLGSSTHADNFKVYLGTEVQMPDPTIEATVGVGLTPAYRGEAYVVFDHMDCPNGQIPQLSFEVVSTATTSSGNPLYDQVPAVSTTYASILEDGGWQFRSATGGPATDVYKVGPGYHEATSHGVFDFSAGPVPVQGGAYAMTFSFLTSGYSDPMTVLLFNLETGVLSPLMSYVSGSSGNSLRPLYAAYDSITGKFCAVAAATETAERANAITILPSNVLTDALNTPSTPMAFYDNVIYTCGSHGGLTYLKKYDGSSGLEIGEVSSALALDTPTLMVCANANGVYVMENSTSDIATDRSAWKVTDSGWQLLTSTAHYDNLDNTTRTFYATDRYAIVGPAAPAGGTADYRVINFTAITGAEAPVADVIESICVAGGMDAADVDTTGISDTLHGYVINRVASGRANIEPLLKAYFIDVSDSDGNLKFRKRSTQVAVATIPYDDLAAMEPGGAPVDPLPLTRTQESELPRSVAITYINKDADYQPGTETARRQVTDSIYDAAEELPISTTGAHVASVAAGMLYDAWQARNPRKATLTRKYAYLDAADNVTVEYPAGIYTTKRITRAADTGLLVQLELVDADPALYSVTVPGVTPPAAQDGVAYPTITRLELLDIPILRDVDDNAGIYVAIGSYLASFAGAVLYTGADINNLTVRGSISQPAIIGLAQTVLGAFSYQMMDQTNTVDILLTQGTLSSSTRAAILAGATNAAALGDEIIQFVTATDLGGGVYRLSGLLRGCRGTEAAVSTHAAGERFVLLQATGMLRPSGDVADLNVSQLYVAPSIGQSLDRATSKSFANTGVGLRPFAPTNIHSNVDEAGLTISWNRRTRMSENWLAGVVPVGEASESWRIEIYDPDTNRLIRTLTATTSSVVYTRGQQTTDRPPGVVRVEVAQISASYGAGRVGSAQVPCAYSSVAQVSTITLGGTFESGRQIYVSAGPTMVGHLTTVGDATLSGVATALAAAIEAATALTASAAGPVITVTGIPGEPFTLAAQAWSPFATTLTLDKTAAAAQMGSRTQMQARMYNPINFSFVAQPAGTEAVMRLYRAGHFIGSYSYFTSVNNETQYQVHAGLLANFQASGDAATYDIAMSMGYDYLEFYSPVGDTSWTITGSMLGGMQIYTATLVYGHETVTADRAQSVLLNIGGTPPTGGTFTVTLDAVNFQYVAAGGDTYHTAATAFAAAIDADPQYTAAVVSPAPNAYSDDVLITSVTTLVPFSYSITRTIGSMTLAVALVTAAS